MSIATETLEVLYRGNNSTTIPYPIPFPFLETEHIVCTKQGITFLGRVAHRGMLMEDLPDLTNYQFGLDLEVGQTAPPVGTVFCVKHGGVLSLPYEVVTVQSGAPFTSCIVTANSMDAATFSGGDIAAGDEDEIYVLGLAPLELTSGEFTVTPQPNGAGGSVKTDPAIPGTSFLSIRRAMPLTQPTEFQLAGPFPSRAAETALDRLLMQVQQVERQVAVVARAVPGSPMILGGASTADAAVWADDTARGATKPARAGQLGVQLDSEEVWIARSTNAGDWKKAGTWQKEWPVYAPDEVLPAEGEGRYVGTLTQPTAVKSVCIVFVDGNSDGVLITLFAGSEVLLSGSPISGFFPDQNTFYPSDPDAVLPAGTVLTIDHIVTDYGPGQLQGMSVVLNCAHF